MWTEERRPEVAESKFWGLFGGGKKKKRPETEEEQLIEQDTIYIVDSNTYGECLHLLSQSTHRAKVKKINFHSQFGFYWLSRNPHYVRVSIGSAINVIFACIVGVPYGATPPTLFIPFFDKPRKLMLTYDFY